VFNSTHRSAEDRRDASVGFKTTSCAIRANPYPTLHVAEIGSREPASAFVAPEGRGGLNLEGWYSKMLLYHSIFLVKPPGLSRSYTGGFNLTIASCWFVWRSLVPRTHSDRAHRRRAMRECPSARLKPTERHDR